MIWATSQLAGKDVDGKSHSLGSGKFTDPKVG